MLECLLKDADDITSFRTVCNLPFNYMQQETISKNCEGSKLHNDLMNELVVILTAYMYTWISFLQIALKLLKELILFVTTPISSDLFKVPAFFFHVHLLLLLFIHFGITLDFTIWWGEACFWLWKEILSFNQDNYHLIQFFCYISIKYPIFSNLIITMQF